MSMQTKLAFKVEEMKRQAEDGDVHLQRHIASVQEETAAVVEIEHSEDDMDEKATNPSSDINPFFREPLYVGNLCLSSTGDRYYRWIIFVSTSDQDIVPPKSVSEVTYTLHPTYKDPVRKRTKSPFFLDIEGWGIFEIEVTIRFKNNFIRPFIETSHMISVDWPTTTTCIEDGSHQHHEHLFAYRQFKQFRNELISKNKSVSFVQKAASRLKRNLLRTPSPLYFNGFSGQIDDFRNTLKQCLCDERLSALKELEIPDTILDEIGEFAVFCVPLDGIMPNQEVYIEQCSDSKVVIAAPKFNHLRLRQCSNMTVVFPYIMSKMELIDCVHIDIVCTLQCFTYRFDTSQHIRLRFPDPERRVTFYCLETPDVELTVDKVQWTRGDGVDHENQSDHGDGKEDEDGDEDADKDGDGDGDEDAYPESVHYVVPYAKGDWQRVSARWRSAKAPEFTSKIFHARHTLGTTSVPQTG